MNWTWSQEKAAKRRSLSPVPQTDTGRRDEKSQASERNLVKELGKKVPYLRKKGRWVKPAAEKWLYRLFTKNTGLCKRESGRIRADACPVPEG